MPKSFNIGIAYQSEKWILSTEYRIEKWKQSHLTPFPSLAFGTEFNGLKNMPLRAGLHFGGLSEFAISFGAGIHYKKFITDFGLIYQDAVLPFYARGMMIALSFSLSLE